MEFRHCNHLVSKKDRIALYEPGNDSLVYDSFPTLAEAQKKYNIPDDIEFEQGLGQLFIAVPFSARKSVPYETKRMVMTQYVGSYGRKEVELVNAKEIPVGATYIGCDEEFCYYKSEDRFFATI